MDVIAIVAVALGAVGLSMVLGVRKRVTHLERLVLRLQDHVTSLEYPRESDASGAATPIDIDPFVD